MYPGIIPILHSFGLMIPGQLGPYFNYINKYYFKIKKKIPINLEIFYLFNKSLTLTISCYGIPLFKKNFKKTGL